MIDSNKKSNVFKEQFTYFNELVFSKIGFIFSIIFFINIYLFNFWGIFLNILIINIYLSSYFHLFDFFNFFKSSKIDRGTVFFLLFSIFISLSLGIKNLTYNGITSVHKDNQPISESLVDNNTNIENDSISNADNLNNQVTFEDIKKQYHSYSIFQKIKFYISFSLILGLPLLLFLLLINNVFLNRLIYFGEEHKFFYNKRFSYLFYSIQKKPLDFFKIFVFNLSIFTIVLVEHQFTLDYITLYCYSYILFLNITSFNIFFYNNIKINNKDNSLFIFLC